MKSKTVLYSASFDAWGARRSGENWSSAFAASSLSLAGFTQPLTQRGFTGHEMLDDYDLIHMNGRIYDAKLARFLQADPLVDGVANTQGYNRYSYVHNNPLNAIDPSGFSSWTKFRDGVLKPVIQAVVSFYCIPCGAMLAAATTAYYGGSLSQIATAAFSSYIMSSVGAGIGGAGGAGFGFNMATLGYATLGGALSAAQGGKFGHGFVSAGLGSIAGAKLGPIFNAKGFSFPGLIASAVIGGTVSEISGGKFANGAQSAAFSYLASWGASKVEAGGVSTKNDANGSKIKWEKQDGGTDADVEEAKRLWELAKTRRLEDGSIPESVQVLLDLENGKFTTTIKVGPSTKNTVTDYDLVASMNTHEGSAATIIFNPWRRGALTGGIKRIPEATLVHEAVHVRTINRGEISPIQMVMKREVEATSIENWHRKAMGETQRTHYNTWAVPTH